MTGWIIFLTVILFFVFLLALRATVTIAYSDELELSVKVLFIKIRILPAKKKKYKKSMSARKAAKLKKKREKKENKKAAKKEAKKQKKQAKKEESKRMAAQGRDVTEKKTPGEILDIVLLVFNLVKTVVGKFFGHLRIKLTRIKLKIATGDAATTAITYGAVTQAVNVFMPFIDGIKTVKTPKEKNVEVVADFCAEKSEADIEIAFSLRVWHLFHVAFAALGQLIKYFFKTLKRKEEKSVALQERAVSAPQRNVKNKKRKKSR